MCADCYFVLLMCPCLNTQSGRFGRGGVKGCTDRLHSLTASASSDTNGIGAVQRQWSFQIPKHPSAFACFACELWTSCHQHCTASKMSSYRKSTLTSMIVTSSAITRLWLDLHGMQRDAAQQTYGYPGSGCSAWPMLVKQPCSDNKALAWSPKTKAGHY